MTGPRRPWRLAVAGCGAAAFGLHLPRLAEDPAFEVITVADRDPARSRDAARRFAIPRVARHATSDLLEGADMLVVLTGVHEELIETALSAGRHVFTEKPVSLDLARTRALATQAREAGLVLEVGAMRAYDPALLAALAEVPAPAGGWLIKADGLDEAARRRLLPAGYAPYTFADDPPRPMPADLDAWQLTALQILLWQGYHQLTALALAVPGATAVSCTIDRDGRDLHATLRGHAGQLFTLIIGAASPGVFHEQIHLADGDAAATVDFARPYEPARTTRVHTGAHGERDGFDDPFAAMWTAVAARLAGQHAADLPTSVDLALRVEDLAYQLATTLTSSVGAHPERNLADVRN
ncbi:hypothetical protein GCM10027258_81100 [Amycolatopsis stemonae]